MWHFDEGEESGWKYSNGNSFFKKGHENNEIDDVAIKGSQLIDNKVFFRDFRISNIEHWAWILFERLSDVETFTYCKKGT